MLWPDSTSRTASCLNSSVYRARVTFVICIPFADSQLRDTFRGGKIKENRTWSTTHRIGEEDKAAMTAMRAIVEPNKGRLQGTAARGPFDSIMSRVVAPVGVTFAPDAVGGVSGWW